MLIMLIMLIVLIVLIRSIVDLLRRYGKCGFVCSASHVTNEEGSMELPPSGSAQIWGQRVGKDLQKASSNVGDVALEFVSNDSHV